MPSGTILKTVQKAYLYLWQVIVYPRNLVDFKIQILKQFCLQS